MSEAVIQAGNRKVPETDAGYANARLRGMRSNLLPLAFYDRLIQSTDVTQAVKELMGTEYGPDLESELVRGRTAAVIDDALKNNMVRSYQKVFSFLHPSARTLLSTLLGRWDVFNIKTILRGAHNKVPHEEVKESFFPAGYMSESDLESLSKFDEVGDIVNTMATWGLVYAAPLRRAFPAYSQDNDLAPLELALDQQYADWASARLKGRSADAQVARRVLGMQIDTSNLVMVLRLLKADIGTTQAEKFFLQGGRSIHKELFLEVAALSDVDEVLDRLKRTSYSSALDEAGMQYLESNSITVFERALEEQVMRQALKSGVKDPHGVGVAIAYLYGKQNEVTNLRIVVKGIAVGMPADRVREELILV
jgi:V/A-type H+/Na+-transporting ATPase subunit C